jgi:Fe-S cluster assembly protein SufD
MAAAPPPAATPARAKPATSTPPSPAYAREFERRAASAREPAWLARARREAFQRFVALGFPTVRDEAWRLTSVAAIARTEWAPAAKSAADVPPRAAHAVHAACVDGRFRVAPAAPEGLPLPLRLARLEDGGDVVERHLHSVAPFASRAFVAWNASSFEDGLLLHVPRGGCLVAPVTLDLLATADAAGRVLHPRVLVVVEEGGHLVLVERHGGTVSGAGSAGLHLTNAVTEVVIGPHAAVDHVRIEDETTGDHVATVAARLDRDARYSFHAVSVGSPLARVEVDALLAAPGAEVELNGLYLAGGLRHVDHRTTIDHAAPHGTSRQTFKGILGGSSTGVFDGTVRVREGASKTDAQQADHALLLSDDATSQSKPALEILTDDVKCSHGATAGRLDDAALFYLRSRGLSAADAKDVLVRAFASDVLDRLPGEAIRHDVEAAFARALAALSAPRAGDGKAS